MASREQTREPLRRENSETRAQPAKAQENPPAPEPACGVSQTPVTRLRVLLVDDNYANRLVASCILAERGHQVEMAGDGSEALRLAQVNPYDVILMDVEMPGMDGLQATAAIRTAEMESVPGCRNGPEGASQQLAPSPVPWRVPIIAMTAHELPEDRERCLAAGMDGYLAKPLDAPTLVALVEGLAAGAGKQLPAAGR
jgi:CheY-like chemotaxis protein